LDAGFFEGKLSFTAEYFRSLRTDILIQRTASVPDYTGLELPSENLGEVLNRGFELDLNYRRQAHKLFYFIRGNMSFARNKVIYLDEATDVPEDQKKEGYPIDSYVLYESDGLFQNQDEIDAYPHKDYIVGPGDVKLIDANGDGEITTADRKRIMSSVTPEIMYGINLGGKYKGFELSLFFQGQANAFLMVRPTTVNTNVEYFEGRWQKEGDNKYPRVFYYTNVTEGQSAESSDFWLKSAAFLRLKNVELAYNLAGSVTQRFGIDNVRIFATGSNLFTIDQIKLFDPEANDNDGSYYPQQRIIRLGLTFTL
jgi:hypothetical protein